MKIVTVLGARPQFIKAGSVSREIQKQATLKEIIVHTGQHYDENMSDVFFAEILSLPAGKLEYVKAKSAPVNAGFRTRDSVEEIGVFISKMSMTGRRFSLARIIGDNLMAAPGERLLPVCETKTQRQKFQRAFAQEFLCPFEDLMEYLGDVKS